MGGTFNTFLSGNPLTTLPTGAFDGLDKVVRMDWSPENLTTLSAGTFRGLTSLRNLDLSDAKLTELPSGVFEGLISLRYLYLQNNELTTLPSGVFSDLTNLGAAAGTFNTSLDLSGNPLTTLPTGAFDGLDKVVRMDWSPENLTTLSAGTFRGLTSLRNLDLSDAKLTELPSGVFEGLISLRYLYLQNNELTTLPSGVFSDLTNLGAAAGTFNTSLDLSGNPLTTLPTGAFDGLDKVVRMDWSPENLTTLSAGTFRGLTSLRNLDLSDAKLTELPSGVFEGLISLRYLYLQNNELTTLPSGVFSDLTNLGAAAGTFNTSLDLSGNPLTTLPTGAFDGLDKVITMDWSPENLTTLSAGTFRGLTSLRRLDLSDAKLTELPSGVFEGLISLRYLYLQNNELTTLPSGVFEGLTELDGLRLDGNPGSEFTFATALEREDSTDLTAPPAATVVAKLAEGAPYSLSIDLAVEGGELSSNNVTIAAGATMSEEISVSKNVAAAAVKITPTWSPGQRPSRNFRGFDILSAPIPPLVLFNAVPMPVGTLPDLLSLMVGGASESVDVSGAFRDAEGEQLTFGANSSDEAVATVSVENDSVVVSPKGVGVATITVEAKDIEGSDTAGTQSFDVTVAMERGGYLITPNPDYTWTVVVNLGAGPITLQIPQGDGPNPLDTDGDGDVDNDDRLPSITSVSDPAPPPDGFGIDRGSAVDIDLPSQPTGTVRVCLSSTWAYSSTRDRVVCRYNPASRRWEWLQSVERITEAGFFQVCTEVTGFSIFAIFDESGPPVSADVNNDGQVDSDDALVMYYAFQLKSLLGDGETGGTVRFRRTLLAGRASSPNPSDADLKEMLVKANEWQDQGVDAGGDINGDGSIDGDDALVMYYAYQFENLLGNGNTGGSTRFRQSLLAGRAGKANPSDADLNEMLRKANALRDGSV